MSSKLTDQELLDVLASGSDESSEPLNSAELFLAEFPIERGIQNVKTEIIYYFYLLFCKQRGVPPMYIMKFFSHFKGRFDAAHGKFDRFYKLNPEPFNLTEEELQEFRRQRRQYKHIWLPTSKRRKNEAKLKRDKAQKRKQQSQLKERLKRKHPSEIKSDTSDSTDGSSQK